MYIYEGYFNNIDNTVDTETIEHTSLNVKKLNDVIFTFHILTFDSLKLISGRDLFDTVQSLYEKKVKKIVHTVCNILELFRIVDDYYLVNASTDVVSNLTFPEFVNYSLELFKKQYDEFTVFINDDNNKNAYNSKLEHFSVPELSIAVKFNTELPVKTLYSDFSKMIQQYENYFSTFLHADMSINDMKVIGYYDNDKSTADVFSSLFGTTLDNVNVQLNTTPLNLLYVEPIRMSLTFLKKAKPYKSYLCLDLNDNYVLTLKLNKEIHKNIIGLCVDSKTDSNGKLTTLFCPLRYISLAKPDAGAVSKRANCVFGKCEVTDVDSVTSDDGIEGTKKLYDFANNIAKETNSYDINWDKRMISNIARDGYYPILNAIYRFHTPGTKRGNWHLGSVEENKLLYRLSSYVDKKTYDKLWDDLYNYDGVKRMFYMTSSEDLVTCNMIKDPNCTLWYVKYTRLKGEEIVVETSLSYSKSYIAIPLLRLTLK